MRKRRKRLLRLGAVLLALWLAAPVQAAESIDEVKARQEELRAENEVLEAKLDQLRADESNLLDYQATLEEKIRLTETKIDESREAIRVMDGEIAILEKKLEASRQEHQDTIDLFAQRIRALYKTGGSVGTLEILLNSSSFSDFSLKMTMLSAVTRHDQQLLALLEEYAQSTQEDRERVEAMRADEAQVKKELEVAQQELDSLYAENEAVLLDLEDQQGAARETIEANEAEDEALEEQLQELIRLRNEEERRRQEEAAAAAAAAGGQEITIPDYVPPEYTELGMHEGFSPCWPLPGVSVSNITGHFGDEYFNGPHRGMDIGASYGTPIVAAQAGQVLSAEYHWSWGNNVLIWHNGTFSTRYAHCSSLAVSAGEYVEQGQIIGYVGETGQAFGNHLHFEVYYEASRVAPEPYLGLW